MEKKLDIVKNLHALLQLMVSKEASDLFITAGMPPTLKVHGNMTPISGETLSAMETQNAIFHLMTPAQKQEFQEEQECGFAISPPGIGRFRVSVFQQKQRLGMVLRRIESRIPQIEPLGLPPVIKQLAMEKQGLVMVVGATSTGKSTTMAAMIGYRNRNSRGHIVCIEDPIEFVHEHANSIVTQREVGVDTPSYESALKNTLRQAPDVVLIGEIRSRETMEHAIAVAETGHLCISTLHASNAHQAMERMINLFPRERRDQVLMDLSLNLRAVVAQRLVPSADGKGRHAAVEVLLNTPLISKYIRSGELHKIRDVLTKSKSLGMRTFDQALYKLYQQGAVKYEDALSASDSPNELRLMVKLGQEPGQSSTATDSMRLVESETDLQS